MKLDEAHVRDILRVFCRIPMSRGQLTLYHLVLAAGEAGMKSAEIKEALDLDQAQHRGLMSALAGRVNGTRRELLQHDKPGKDFLFDAHWTGSHMVYRARPELVEAIRRLPDLDALVRSSLSEVVNTMSVSLELPAGVDPNPPLQPKPVKPPKLSGKNPFAEVLADLLADGLHYPSELVANFVLALQTKRFAILTGISGTGKTRIAQALARRYARRGKQKRPVPVDDPRAALLSVMPYMRKYTRFIVPRDLVIQWPWLASLQGGGQRVAVRWDGGEHECAIYADTAREILLSGPARIWFMETFAEVGAPFVLRLDGPEEEPTGLRVEQVEQEEVIDPSPENYDVVAVRPDWTDSRGLLGYFNPITGGYVTTPFLRLVLRAVNEYERATEAGDGEQPEPYFVVLDEMNLARVEHYFSDFLSAMESGEPIALHDVESLQSGEGEVETLAVPKHLEVPPNLYFVGTVNVDESTYMFSPKVLDRAFTLELNEVHLRSYGDLPEWSDDLDLTRWSGRLDPDGTRKPARDDWISFGELEGGDLRRHLIALHDLLARQNRHFGYRVANEVARFVNLAVEQAKDAEQVGWVALDLAILQKVLVKLHGTQAELSELLDQIQLFTLVGLSDTGQGSLSAWKPDPETAELVLAADGEGEEDTSPLFPRSAKKLWRMRRRLREQGFTAWIE